MSIDDHEVEARERSAPRGGFGPLGRALMVAFAAYVLAVAPWLWRRTGSVLGRLVTLAPHALILLPSAVIAVAIVVIVWSPT